MGNKIIHSRQVSTSRNTLSRSQSHTPHTPHTDQQLDKSTSNGTPQNCFVEYNPPDLPEIGSEIRLENEMQRLRITRQSSRQQTDQYQLNLRLLMLFRHPKEKPTVEQLKRLLEEGADPNFNFGVINQLSALMGGHWLSSRHLLMTFLEYNVDVAAPVSDSKHMAVQLCHRCPTLLPVLLEHDYERAKKGLSYDASATVKMLRQKSQPLYAFLAQPLDTYQLHQRHLDRLLNGDTRSITLAANDDGELDVHGGPLAMAILEVERVLYGLDILDSWVARGMRKGQVRIGLQKFLETNVENVLSRTVIYGLSHAVLEFLAPIDIAEGWDQWMINDLCLHCRFLCFTPLRLSDVACACKQ